MKSHLFIRGSGLFAFFVVCSGIYSSQSPTICLAIDSDSSVGESAFSADEGISIAAKNEEKSRGLLRFSPRQILDRVANTYKSCTSYRDSGRFENTVTRKDGSKWSRKIAFRTAFQRVPQRFRFTYRKDYYDRGYQEPIILWHDGQRTLVSEGEPAKFEPQEALGRSVARFTGVSFSTVHNIPALLMPNSIGGRRLIELSHLKPPQIETIEKVVCYRLEGIYADEKMVLWIDSDSYLILKIEEYTSVNEKRGVYATFYDPTLNEKIPNSLLEKEVAGEWVGFKSAP
ncbi:MAG: hypothetical protein KDA57_19190 [Planctomycetales bacterium]|nr:hypothetical protein [Planctomycetales bacterium]